MAVESEQNLGLVAAGSEALAQEIRLRVVIFLRQRGLVGATSAVIAKALDSSANALGFHLRLLTRMGLIQIRRVGRFHVYVIDESMLGAWYKALQQHLPLLGGGNTPPFVT